MACSASLVEESLGVGVGPFSVTYSNGLDRRDTEYRLRHEVFVEERGWLPAAPDGERLEQDELDAHCVALLLTDQRSGDAAACQRFILPDRLPATLMTNVERYADCLTVDFSRLGRGDWAEVSRSTIAPAFRWGSATPGMPALVAVKYASVALAVALARRTLLSFSDLRTARLTRRLGFHLQQVGAPVQFHGVRAPFRIDVAEAMATIPASAAHDLRRLIEAACRVVRRVE